MRPTPTSDAPALPTLASVPTIPELQDRTRFALLARIGHEDVAGAIRPYVWRVTPVTIAYGLVNLAALVWLGMAWRRSGAGFLAGFPTASLGMMGSYLLLVPVHEALHALAYRLRGARGVRVHFAWRRLTAHCVADRAVLGRGDFAVVCLLPVAVLNPLLLAISLVLPAGDAQLAAAAALLLHTGAVSGDVALVNLLWRARGTRAVWTYDDVGAGESYFYVAASSPAPRCTTAG